MSARRAKRSRAKSRGRARRPAIAVSVREIDSLRDELKRRTKKPPRWNADPEDVQRSVARLVLSLVEFLRKLMERQAIRRMDAGTLTSPEIEAVGQALMRLEDTVREIAARFELRPEDLNLDLGPIGRLT
jgi:gas vesicle protein GvpK